MREGRRVTAPDSSRLTSHVSRPVRIAVISDTHNYLDPRIPALFSGVDHILHAGDIGKAAILLALEQVAPVTAVGGNTDDPGFHYREIEVVRLAGRAFLLRHIVDPRAPGPSLQARLAGDRPDVVVFGHSHKPFCHTIGGVLFFNPGYAGRQRFLTKQSVAILHCESTGLRAEYLALTPY
jgi:uncharacterized protein